MAERVSADQRRRDLVEAAFRVMSQVGIQRATTRAICAEAGVHQSVFHYCFRSKKELYQALIKSVVVGMVDAAVQVPSPARSANEAIRAAIERVWADAKAHPARQLVAYELTTLALRDPELVDLAAWQYEQYFEQSARVATAVAESADIEWDVPLPVLSRMFTTAVDGLILGWLCDRNDEVAALVLEQFANALAALTHPRVAAT